MKQSNANSNNPLRISQESLNLDDIISDLNEGNHQKSTIATSEHELKNKQSLNQQKIANTPSTHTHLKGKSQLASKNKVGSSTSTAGNKENNNKSNENKSMGVKGTGFNQQFKDQLVSNTVEGQIKSTQRDEEGKKTRDEVRYNDSNFKFDSLSQGLITTDDHTEVSSHAKSKHFNPSQETPFYIQTTAGSITDEDVESFQKKLDTLIINFRSETMSEFMRTKKQVLQDQAQTVDAERRRCNTLLGVKQNEIEQLKENLAQKTKMGEELGIRCEIMALWAGTGKTMARVKVLQYKCFSAFKQYKEFKKHSKKVLELQLKRHKDNLKKGAFLGWEKQYKQWKIQKNKDDFDKAVKMELQHICAQYSKEIESLRQKLDEANQIVDQENKNKAMMQENLKKAFM